MSDRWLSIIGIGEDGRAGISPAANALIDAAELLVGGRRHLDLIGATRATQMPWLNPLDATDPGNSGAPRTSRVPCSSRAILSGSAPA